MKKEFVTYEIALELKKLGFKEDCICYFNQSKNLKSKISYSSGKDCECVWGNDDKDDLRAPLWQQAIDWIKCNYKLLVNENLGYRDFFWEVLCPYNINYCFDTREQAILKAIEIIKSK